jgi:hypothetical protein
MATHFPKGSRAGERGAEEALLDAFWKAWEKDATLWKKDPEEKKYINSLGWLTSRPRCKENRAMIESSRQRSGMKGSSTRYSAWGRLAPLVIKVVRPGQGYLELTVLDSTDPEAVAQTAARMTSQGRSLSIE